MEKHERVNFTEALNKAKGGAYITRTRYGGNHIFFVWVWVHKEHGLGFLARASRDSTIEYAEVTKDMEDAVNWYEVEK